MNTKQEYVIGDCLELLPSIPDKSIDCIITDLPYGTTCCAWDTCIDLDRLWPEYKRIIKDNGAIVLFGSQPFTTVLISSNIEMFKYEWIWEKENGSDFLNAKNKPLKLHENIMVFSKGTTANGSDNKMNYFPVMIQGKPYKKINRHDPRQGYVAMGNRTPFDLSKMLGSKDGKRYPKSILKFNKVGHNSIHPVQKPISLIEYLIKTYTNEGDTVHDSCLGSGTTLEACMNTNRNCIGFEISDEWVGHYVKRLRLDNSKLDNWL